MTGCYDYNELISLAVDGEISIEEDKQLKSHLDVCPECRSLFETMVMLSKEFDGIQVEPPKKLASDVMYKIRQESKRKISLFPLFGRISAAAAVIVIIVFAGYKVMPMLGTQTASINTENLEAWPMFVESAEPYHMAAPDEKTINEIPQNEAEYGVMGNIEPSPTASPVDDAAARQPEPDIKASITLDDQADSISDDTDTQPITTPEVIQTTRPGYMSPFESTLRAKDIWESNKFDETYYCVAILNESQNMDGYELVSQSDSEIYYKLSVDTIEEFKEKDSFAEIYYDNLKADYGIVVLRLG